jgi:hypothetical protein
MSILQTQNKIKQNIRKSAKKNKFNAKLLLLRASNVGNGRQINQRLDDGWRKSGRTTAAAAAATN